MAHWDYKDRRIHYSPAQKKRNGWYSIDCGCCGGLEWGGLEPRECNRCKGTGVVWWHKKSKVFKDCPQGHFISGKGNLSNLELNGGTI